MILLLKYSFLRGAVIKCVAESVCRFTELLRGILAIELGKSVRHESLGVLQSVAIPRS
jgi:hypothetical protein